MTTDFSQELLEKLPSLCIYWKITERYYKNPLVSLWCMRISHTTAIRWIPSHYYTV